MLGYCARAALLLALAGCAATYKPPVDLQQTGTSQAQHDSDLAECRRQASNLSLAAQQGKSPVRTFGSNNASANQAVSYGNAKSSDVALLSQPGGMQRYLDLCMQRKGYQFAE